MAGQSIGKYQLIKKLATGGMAEVWLANQIGIEGFNRHIVVKRILPHLSEDPEFVQMFLNEAKIASRFNHPNIAQIYDLGNAEGQYFIAMEFIHGEDLGRLMRKAWSTGQWIARPLAIRIVAEACKGLFYAHTRNDERGQPLRVVHRDISPQNILISFDGSVKLVDFGIAKAADQASMTKSGAIKGKFAYMAPEQAGGKPLDARTDLFALGLVLYELLTGVRPLKRDSELATLQAALECAIDPPSVVAEVPSELDDVVMRALAKAPDDRYRDSSMFQMALEEFLISQRLVATSVQISELMETLFAERRAEEARLGAPNPSVQGESQQGLPAMPEVPAPRERRRREEPRVEQDFTGTDRAKPGEAGGRNGEPEAVPEWEAPVGAPVVPSRKYSNPNQTSAQRAHQPMGGPEMTRQKPPTREVEEAQVEPRKSRVGLKRNGVNGHARLEDDQEAPTEMPAPRRTSSAPKLRRTATGEMPEAPPRRASSDALAAVADPDDVDVKPRKATNAGKEPLSGSIEIDRKRKSQAAVRGGVTVFLLLVIGGAAGLMWKMRDKISSDDGSRVPILLSVTSSPPTRVYVLKEGKHGDTPLDLGQTPLEEARGVFVLDSILMTNDAMCLKWEEPIKYGQPREVKKIEKTFKQCNLEVVTKPATTKNPVTIFCNTQKIGTTVSKFNVYEGPHHLEIRGEQLNQPVFFDVNVVCKTPGEVNRVTVDISEAVNR